MRTLEGRGNLIALMFIVVVVIGAYVLAQVTAPADIMCPMAQNCYELP